MPGGQVALCPSSLTTRPHQARWCGRGSRPHTYRWYASGKRRARWADASPSAPSRGARGLVAVVCAVPPSVSPDRSATPSTPETPTPVAPPEGGGPWVGSSPSGGATVSETTALNRSRSLDASSSVIGATGGAWVTEAPSTPAAAGRPHRRSASTRATRRRCSPVGLTRTPVSLGCSWGHRNLAPRITERRKSTTSSPSRVRSSSFCRPVAASSQSWASRCALIWPRVITGTFSQIVTDRSAR